MGVVNPAPQVEVQQVKAVAGLAQKDKRAQTECGSKRILPGQSQNDAAEQRHQQSVVKKDEGHQRPHIQKTQDARKAGQSQQYPQTARARH